MKKTLLMIGILFAICIVVIGIAVTENNKKWSKIKEINSQYEIYRNKEIYGTDVATLINKIIDYNNKNEIAKNEEGLFIENDINSIKCEIQFLYDEEIIVHPVETVYNRGLNSFIQNFNLIKFKIIDIQYHTKTKQISKIVLKQLEP